MLDALRRNHILDRSRPPLLKLVQPLETKVRGAKERATFGNHLSSTVQAVIIFHDECALR
eukprot:6308946-Pyramimonas_sp.AAC.1